jgi:hypothetical protein
MTTEPMDDFYKYFLEDEGFGPAIHSRTVNDAEIEKYRGKLPDQLLKYWALYGWSGYAKGLFWLVDPAEYAPVVKAWLSGTDFLDEEDHHVIARGAFGKVYLWGEKSGQNLTINAPWARIFPRDQREKMKSGKADLLVRGFLTSKTKANVDLEDRLEQPLFDRALAELGALAHDEMYGFEPALALGAPCELKFLKKVKAVEHLMLLAQIHPPRIMEDVVKVGKESGAVK